MFLTGGEGVGESIVEGGGDWGRPDGKYLQILHCRSPEVGTSVTTVIRNLGFLADPLL